MPYKTTGKIILLYILIFKFLDRKLEDIGFFNKCINFCITVGPRFTNLIRSWWPFVNRNQAGMCTEPKLTSNWHSRADTLSLPPLPACVFVIRETVRHPRRFFCSENLFVNRNVREQGRSWTEAPLYLISSIFLFLLSYLVWLISMSLDNRTQFNFHHLPVIQFVLRYGVSFLRIILIHQLHYLYLQCPQLSTRRTFHCASGKGHYKRYSTHIMLILVSI
jgi:hypothetical protein